MKYFYTEDLDNWDEVKIRSNGRCYMPSCIKRIDMIVRQTTTSGEFHALIGYCSKHGESKIESLPSFTFLATA